MDIALIILHISLFFNFSRDFDLGGDSRKLMLTGKLGDRTQAYLYGEIYFSFSCSFQTKSKFNNNEDI